MICLRIFEKRYVPVRNTIAVDNGTHAVSELSGRNDSESSRMNPNAPMGTANHVRAVMHVNRSTGIVRIAESRKLGRLHLFDVSKEKIRQRISCVAAVKRPLTEESGRGVV